jgi:hypothetical protein
MRSTRLGPYEISALIGRGGMGEVYQALDTNLGRQVAIKILPDTFADDPERLARFEREAKTLAVLNHPNIAHIYGFEKTDGIRALVMELVEGPTLAERIKQGATSVDEVLPLARQVVEALDSAHAQGIVHRDLKPDNVKIRPDGTVKVLDFGLAKALEPAIVSPAGSHSPTITTPAMTRAGMILGTAAYMSPEQAKGRGADKRSDIWAFGCVLYEMLTGRRAFDEGHDVVATLAAVIHREPNWAALPAAVPTPIRRLLRRCLEKDPNRRLPDIAVARLEIDDALMPGADGANAVGALATSELRPRWSGLGPLVAVGTVTAVLGGIATWSITRPTPTRAAPVTRLTITLPAADSFAPSLNDAVLALSPDGTHLVYVAGAQWCVPSIGLTLLLCVASSTRVTPFFRPMDVRSAFSTVTVP